MIGFAILPCTLTRSHTQLNLKVFTFKDYCVSFDASFSLPQKSNIVLAFDFKL